MFEPLERMIERLIRGNSSILIEHQHVLQKIDQLTAVDLFRDQLRTIYVRWNVDLNATIRMSRHNCQFCIVR